jgi:hypothetical protein
MLQYEVVIRPGVGAEAGVVLDTRFRVSNTLCVSSFHGVYICEH